jgi:hypothetical protein
MDVLTDAAPKFALPYADCDESIVQPSLKHQLDHRVVAENQPLIAMLDDVIATGLALILHFLPRRELINRGELSPSDTSALCDLAVEYLIYPC